MTKTKKSRPVSASELTWRTPDSRKRYKLEDDEPAYYVNNITINSATVLGFCTIHERKEKAGVSLRVELDHIDVPNIDVYFCVRCTDFRDRDICFIVDGGVTKFLLAYPRQFGVIVITNEKILFQQGENWLHTDLISVADMDFLKYAISDYLGQGTSK